MNAIINGTIILPDTAVEGCALLYEDDVICGVVHREDVPADATLIDAGGGYVMPGLIDLHIHGYGGCDVCDGDPAALRRMDAHMLKNGVTGWLATTMTADEETLRLALESCRMVMAEKGHALLGVHAEGPYINPAKAGAQNAAHATAPNVAFIKEYADVIRLLTLAPEQDPDFATIRATRLSGRNQQELTGTWRMAEQVDPEKQTRNLFFTPDALPADARPGQLCRLDMYADGGEQGYVNIPDSALVKVGIDDVVFLEIKEGTFAMVKVQAGTSRRGMTPVKGLIPGQKLVVKGGYELRYLLPADGSQQKKAGHFHADGKFHEGEDH